MRYTVRGKCSKVVLSNRQLIVSKIPLGVGRDRKYSKYVRTCNKDATHFTSLEVRKFTYQWGLDGLWMDEGLS